jgi:glutaredoxin-like protein DUF836
MSSGHSDGDAILYSRAHCPLCFALLRSARRAARRHGFALRVVDVADDPLLEVRYGRDVPVLLLPDGRSILGRAGYAEVEALFVEAALAAGKGRGPLRPVADRVRPSVPWLRRFAGRLRRARGGT